MRLLSAYAIVIGTSACGGATHSDTEIAAARATATGSNEASFAAALAARGLAQVAARQHVWTLDYGGTAPFGVFEDREDSTAKVHVLMVGTADPSCGPPAPRELVSGRDGKVYVVVRKPHVVRTRALRGPCPIASASCGGMPAPPVALGYELPADAAFGGPLDVAYDIDQVDVTSDTKCPQPSPPP